MLSLGVFHQPLFWALLTQIPNSLRLWQVLMCFLDQEIIFYHTFVFSQTRLWPTLIILLLSSTQPTPKSSHPLLFSQHILGLCWDEVMPNPTAVDEQHPEQPQNTAHLPLPVLPHGCRQGTALTWIPQALVATSKAEHTILDENFWSCPMQSQELSSEILTGPFCDSKKTLYKTQRNPTTLQCLMPLPFHRNSTFSRHSGAAPQQTNLPATGLLHNSLDEKPPWKGHSQVYKLKICF